MKQSIRELIENAFQQAHESGALSSGQLPDFNVETPRFENQGDLSTNIAMISASLQKMAPKAIAEAIVSHIEVPSPILERVEIAGPGFINFFIPPRAWHGVLQRIHAAGPQYGRCDIGAGQKVQVEFVSANPTGPLHVGHGRGAALGDALARILDRCGYRVEKEYYINDSGRQIRTLGLSVFLRYQELLGHPVEFPAEGYQGDYIRALAEQVRAEKGDSLLEMEAEEAIADCARTAARAILEGIGADLAAFGVRFDSWFSEQQLYDQHKVETALNALQAQGLVYSQDGALWFRTSRYGDEKDRVVVRQNGLTTYFASDIAYHRDKFARGFDRVIDVWGADHHGYIPRMKAAVAASGYQPEQFEVILVQLVNLLRAGEPVPMSTRAGEFVTLKDVVDEVGKDAARFIFLTRDHASKLDFDLELAKQKSNDNPVYYVQYVHARIASIQAKAREKRISDFSFDPEAVARLQEAEEIALIKLMARYPEAVALAATHCEPHRVPYYLSELAAGFHAYYNKHRVLGPDPELTRARLSLVLAVQQIIANGLTLLGVSAPEQM